MPYTTMQVPMTNGTKPRSLPERAQRRSEAPERRVAAAAVVAFVVVDADQDAARGAEDRTGSLSSEHGFDDSLYTSVNAQCSMPNAQCPMQIRRCVDRTGHRSLSIEHWALGIENCYENNRRHQRRDRRRLRRAAARAAARRRRRDAPRDQPLGRAHAAARDDLVTRGGRGARAHRVCARRHGRGDLERVVPHRRDDRRARAAPRRWPRLRTASATTSFIAPPTSSSRSGAGSCSSCARRR